MNRDFQNRQFVEVQNMEIRCGAHSISNYNDPNRLFCKSRFIDHSCKNSIQSETICLFNCQDKISLFLI